MFYKFMTHKLKDFCTLIVVVCRRKQPKWQKESKNPDILMESVFRKWAKHQYMLLHTPTLCCPDFFDFMNEQNTFLDSQPNEPAPRPITPSEVYIAPSSLQNFNKKNKAEKFDISDIHTLATKDHSDMLERKIMKGRHTELSYEYLTEIGQYWRDCIVESILYKLIKFENVDKLLSIKAYRYVLHLCSTYAILDMVEHHYTTFMDTTVNATCTDLIKILNAEWLFVMKHQKLNIKQIAVPDILSEDDSENDSDTV